MVIAVWIGATVEHIHFNLWLLGGLGAGVLVARILNLIRGGCIADLSGSWVFDLWVATRFLLTPALFLLGLAWVICSVFKLAAAAVVLKALTFTAVYGCAAIFVTSLLVDLAAAIKGPDRAPPSDG